MTDPADEHPAAAPAWGPGPAIDFLVDDDGRHVPGTWKGRPVDPTR